MKIVYNKKELTFGSLFDTENIKQNVLRYFETENEAMCSEWHLRFNSEIKELNNFKQLSADKNCLLDIGAQFGAFSYTFLGDSVTKKSFAFDGGINPYLAMSQAKQLNSLDNFYPYNFLIGNQNEIVSCFSETNQSLAIPGDDKKLMLSIDMIVELFDVKPDVIKIDVEGCEFEVLKGAYNTIIEFNPTIFVEIHPKFMQMYNASTSNIASFVNSINYKVLDLNQCVVENYLDILNQETTDSNRTIWVPNK